MHNFLTSQGSLNHTILRDIEYTLMDGCGIAGAQTHSLLLGRQLSPVHHSGTHEAPLILCLQMFNTLEKIFVVLT
ncbi:hypothetical protein AOLI_G00148320 [Acnodon oligacanthus]